MHHVVPHARQEELAQKEVKRYAPRVPWDRTRAVEKHRLRAKDVTLVGTRRAQQETAVVIGSAKRAQRGTSMRGKAPSALGVVRRAPRGGGQHDLLWLALSVRVAALHMR